MHTYQNRSFDISKLSFHAEPMCLRQSHPPDQQGWKVVATVTEVRTKEGCLQSVVRDEIDL